MLWTILIVLSVIWALGIVTANTMGGAIHLLLFAAIAIVIIRSIQGRKPLA